MISLWTSLGMCWFCIGHSWKSCFEHDLSIYDIFNNIVICSDYIASNCDMITEYWIWKDMGGRSYGLISDNIIPLAWQDWEKPQKPSLAEIWTWDLPNANRSGTHSLSRKIRVFRTCCTTQRMWIHGYNWFQARLYHESVKVQTWHFLLVLMNVLHVYNSVS
jgi:hypothetical protein